MVRALIDCTRKMSFWADFGRESEQTLTLKELLDIRRKSNQLFQYETNRTFKTKFWSKRKDQSRIIWNRHGVDQIKLNWTNLFIWSPDSGPVRVTVRSGQLRFNYIFQFVETLSLTIMIILRISNRISGPLFFSIIPFTMKMTFHSILYVLVIP